MSEFYSNFSWRSWPSPNVTRKYLQSSDAYPQASTGVVISDALWSSFLQRGETISSHAPVTAGRERFIHGRWSTLDATREQGRKRQLWRGCLRGLVCEFIYGLKLNAFVDMAECLRSPEAFLECGGS